LDLLLPEPVEYQGISKSEQTVRDHNSKARQVQDTIWIDQLHYRKTIDSYRNLLLEHHHYIRILSGPQEAISISSRDDMIRILGLVLAAALLNVGLYLVLYVLAPLVAGMVCGFFLLSPKWGTFVGFMGSACSNIPFLIWLESISPTGADMLSIIIAAMILSAIGAVGGFIGGMIGARTRYGSQS
jgi:hypothetical protein